MNDGFDIEKSISSKRKGRKKEVDEIGIGEKGGKIGEVNDLYISIIYTPILTSSASVLDCEREQGRFKQTRERAARESKRSSEKARESSGKARGSSEKARRSSERAQERAQRACSSSRL